MDQHVQRHESRAAIMPRNGTGTVRTRRDRPVEHGKPGQVPVRGMAALGRMESTGGLRRPLPWHALDGDERVRRIAAVAAETMPKQHVGRIVEACAKASRSEDEFIRRVRREGFSIDPHLRKGAARDSFDSPDQVVGYRITWRSRDGWTERFNATDLGADMRLKELRNGWTHDARSESLAVQEWRASMENRPPFLADGLERRPANLSTHDMERLIDEAFHVAVNVRRGEGDPEAYDEALREGLRVFDRLSERYGLGDGFSAEIMKDELSAETPDAIGDDGRDENGKAHKP